MASTKEIVELSIRIGVLEKLVDNLISRVDDSIVRATQAESLVKQVIEVVQKVQVQQPDKDVWDDIPASPEVPDELTMFTGGKVEEKIKQ